MDFKDHITKIRETLKEVKKFTYYKDIIMMTVSKLENEYQRGRYDYFEYKAILSRYLRGKKLDDLMAEYDSYIEGLREYVRTINNSIYKFFSEDKSEEGITLRKSFKGDRLMQRRLMEQIPKPSNQLFVSHKKDERLRKGKDTLSKHLEEFGLKRLP